jgi:archaellum component FlaC
MPKDILGELRNIFIEAIGSHKFIEMKYGRNQTDEINKLKEKYVKLKKCFEASEKEGENVSYEQLNSSTQNLEKRLDNMEQELCSIKIKLIEQQKETSQIINQIEKQLAEIKLVRNTENVLVELELPMSSGITNNKSPKHQHNHVVHVELDSLRKQLDEL